MLFVISVHAIGFLPVDSKQRELFYHMERLIFFTCNGLFYMFSGKFSLQTRCETKEELIQYYKKKLINLVFPILAYMFLRYFHDCNWSIRHEGFWNDFIGNVFNGYSSMEYWYLYVLMGNIVLAPFIGPALQKLGKKEMQIFLLIGIINASTVYVSLLGYEWGWSYPLGAGHFVFILALELIE